MGSTGRISVDARKILVIAKAGFEGAILGIVGGIVGTADMVIDALAEVGGIGVGRVTGFEAECI